MSLIFDISTVVWRCTISSSISSGGYSNRNLIGNLLRIWGGSSLEYPPEEIELEIVQRHTTVDISKINEIKRAIKLAKNLREAAAVEELYYSPSLRESIAFAKLLNAGSNAKQAAEIVYANAYDQWGEVEYQKVMNMITSIFV